MSFNAQGVYRQRALKSQGEKRDVFSNKVLMGDVSALSILCVHGERSILQPNLLGK
jgi:hypothetical protein